jgi:hypothetical protein
MKIKINQNLISINGTDPIFDNGKALSLKDVSIAAVLTPNQEDDFVKKMTKYEIFKKLRDAEEEVELSAEEIATIKAASGKIHPPLVYGQTCEMLEKS